MTSSFLVKTSADFLIVLTASSIAISKMTNGHHSHFQLSVHLRGMLDWHRQDEVLGELVELGDPVVGQDDGQHVEVGSFPGPAQFLAELEK